MKTCELCGKPLEVVDQDHTEGTIWYACPEQQDGNDEHTSYHVKMTTAREFLLQKNYEDSESNLSKLTRYLGDEATTDYSQFPDAALPEDFTADLDDAEFEEHMDR